MGLSREAGECHTSMCLVVLCRASHPRQLYCFFQSGQALGGRGTQSVIKFYFLDSVPSHSVKTLVHKMCQCSLPSTRGCMRYGR